MPATKGSMQHLLHSWCYAPDEAWLLAADFRIDTGVYLLYIVS
jgi:hypothetical protein